MTRRESLPGKNTNGNSGKSLAQAVQRLLRGNRRDADVVRRTDDRARHRRGSIVLVGRFDGVENPEITDDKPQKIAQVLRANKVIGPNRVVGLRTMVPETPLSEPRRLSADASVMHRTIVDEFGAIATLNPLPIRAVSKRRESPYDVLLTALDELQEEVQNVEPHPDSPSPCLVVMADARYAASVFGHRLPNAINDLGDGNLIGLFEVNPA